MNISEIKRLIESGKFSQARETLENYIRENDAHTDALNLLAFLYLQSGEFSKAVKTLERTAELNPESAAPLINLGIAHYQKEKYDKALDYLSRAVNTEPQNPLARYNYALALAESGKTDESIAQYEKAIEIKPDYYDAYYNLSMLYLLKKNYEKGFEYYEYRFKSNELKRKELEGKRWRGEDAKDKTLYVYSDQGFGDAIQFVRLLKLAKEKVGKIVLEVQAELLSLMKNSGLADKVVPTRPDFSPMSEFDIQIPLMSLPYALKLTPNSVPAEIPYIFSDDEKTERWKALLDAGDKLKIGIAWRGNPVYRKNHIRSANLKNFENLFRTKNAVFFSLQKNPYEREREFLLANEAVDLSEYLRDFSETAAIMQNLDLIITTDTVIPHLAGALGKKTWTLLAKFPDWRWGSDGDATPWYPTMKLFRQSEQGDWKSVAERVETELSKFAAHR